MKIPNASFNVKVGAFCYEVVYDRMVVDSHDAIGMTGHNHLKILIDPSIAQPQQRITFLHELLHACMYASGLSHRFRDKAERLPDEEEVVNTLSNILAQVIDENPHVFSPEVRRAK